MGDISIPTETALGVLGFLFQIGSTVAIIALAHGRITATLKALAERIAKVEERHDTHVEKLDKLCNEVSELVGRFDMLLNLGRADAMKRRSA